jgi:hypothetical protein
MMMLVALSVVAGLGHAAIVQDYESYTNTLGLLNDHTVTANLTISLNTTTVHDGAKSMKFAWNNGQSPYYAIARDLVPGAVWNSFGANWNDFSELSVWYNVETKNGNDALKIQFVDAWGTTLYNHNFGNVVAGQGWQQAVINLHDHLTESQLNHIGRIDLIVSGNYGNGVMYFDDMTLTPKVPEPASLALLGAGGLLLRRRRK